ncbi:MAG: hypothetical protein AAF485_00805 [Chloroflexota bacterium]
MTDLRDTIEDNEGWIERIAGKIPIYKGYREKEQRREADNLLRQHLSEELGDKLRQAEDVSSQMLTGPGLMQLDEMGKGNTRLQTLIDKVKTAAQGYSGLFDAIKFKEDELDTLYEFDHTMLVQADEIGAAIDAVQASLDSGDTSTLPATVRRYVKTVSDASATFDKRKDAILGLI